MTAGGSVLVTGWLIIIDFKLYLVQVDQAEQVENCESSQRIEVSEPEIIFSVLERILPLGGGNSFIFHRARVCGVMASGVQSVVKVISMSVEERGGGFVSIAIGGSAERHRAKYQEFISKRGIKSSDWLDYY
ncbi:hypothetical protein ACM792_07290 [Metapseudomonas otitidis]|uniref:hypothetical protein n=1 Tax=Metapseudomonas otitidis TaxID=319939 RepID=UPI00281219EC|nr:hypothetical protein [Pseudomonas otitidis]WMR33825.1 hypothetical protein QT513_03550 [Pseudomonas otitidis]